jgi:PTH1 family peptidyl-tRNA hydrolase
MDLPPGKIRLKQKIGTGGGHNGIRSIVEYQGSVPWVLYIGIGRPSQSNAVIEHVLGEPDEIEEEKIRSAISQGLDGINLIIAGELQAGMNVINSSRN